MMHMSISQWTKYVNNELEEQEREVYENHLYSCDQCLAVYLQVLAENEAHLPSLSTNSSFVDDIMFKIEENNQAAKRETNITENKITKRRNETKLQIIKIKKYPEQELMEQLGPDEKVNAPSDNKKPGQIKPSEKVVPIEQSNKKSFYESTMFHYIVAAAMTLILMVSGVFSSMTGLADSIEQSNRIETPSFTEGLLNKTLSIMDGIDEKLNEDTQSKNKQKQSLKEVEK